MKRLWKHKWVVVGVSLVIFLSIGTAAWAATGSSSNVTSIANSSGTTVTTAAGDSSAPLDGTRLKERMGSLKERMGSLKERCQQMLERQKARLSELREKMTPEDQTKYDQLMQQAKDQKAALDKARTDLSSTLKDLRSLAQKYGGAVSGTTSTTGVTQ